MVYEIKRIIKHTKFTNSQRKVGRIYKFSSHNFSNVCKQIAIVQSFFFLIGWILYHFSNNPIILGIHLTCFSKKMELKKMTNWDTILNVIMILNIIGEAIPQAVIR